MPRFSSPALALEWAETILSIREGGRSNAAMMEMLGNGGLPRDYALLDAIEIRAAAKKACGEGHPCSVSRVDCLFRWFVFEECGKHTGLSDSQRAKVRECAGTFEAKLRAKGFLE